MTPKHRPAGRSWAKVARRHRPPAMLGIEPAFRPEDLAWLADAVGAHGTPPDVGDFPTSLLVALAHASRDRDRPAYGPSARASAVLIALYLRTQPGRSAPVAAVDAAVSNAYIAVMMELLRRLGFIAACRVPGGIFGDELAWQPHGRGLAQLEAVAAYDGTVDGVRLPPHVFNRAMVHLGALTDLYSWLPQLRDSLDDEWVREVQAA
jgi:hypothetical protein